MSDAIITYSREGGGDEFGISLRVIDRTAGIIRLQSVGLTDLVDVPEG